MIRCEQPSAALNRGLHNLWVRCWGPNKVFVFVDVQHNYTACQAPSERQSRASNRATLTRSGYISKKAPVDSFLKFENTADMRMTCILC